jgi:general stress protein 26
MDDSTTTMARRTIYRSTAQKLTDGMRAFLERQPFAMLATHNPDGSIHVVSLSYMFEDGRFFFATSSSSRKARNFADRHDAHNYRGHERVLLDLLVAAKT